MGKLIKYELKGNYKTFLGLFAIISLLNILILTRINKWSSPAVFSLMSVVTIVLFAIILALVVQSFRNEMYEDRAYLTFTLPVSGNKILASKLITAIIWFIGGSVITFVFFKILLDNLLNTDILKQMKFYFDTNSVFVGSALFSIINLVMLLLMIYFSITLTRVALKGKRMSKFLGFVTFILLNIAIFYVESKIIDVFPYTFSVKVHFFNEGQAISGFLQGNNQSMININNPHLNINIARIIYNILVYIGLFISTSYLMENKIDI